MGHREQTVSRRSCVPHLTLRYRPRRKKFVGRMAHGQLHSAHLLNADIECKRFSSSVARLTQDNYSGMAT